MANRLRFVFPYQTVKYRSAYQMQIQSANSRVHYLVATRAYVTTKGIEYFISNKCEDSANLMEIEARKIISSLHTPSIFASLITSLKTADTETAITTSQRLEHILESPMLLLRFKASLQSNWLEDVITAR